MVAILHKGLTVFLILTLTVNLIPSLASSSESVQVSVEFKSAYTDLNLLYLQILGYDFEVIDQLHNVMHGAVISIDADKVDMLKKESIVSEIYEEKFLKANLDKSTALVGVDRIRVMDSNGRELTGEGVRVAVIDTGIDYTHQDLFGFGKGGKVVDGYDFLNRNKEPLDTDGHGTLVAGIIAANGNIKGVAPDAELVAYRIASHGSYVSTTDMLRALDRAVDDKVDIVNISLGLDYVSQEIDRAIEELIRKGVVVVTAAGNNGQAKPIGSPASAHRAISVGASLNNVTLSAVSTLKIDDDARRYNVITMLGSAVTDKPVRGKLVFGNFAKAEDFADIDVRGAIVLAERGGPMVEVDGRQQSEIVYFTDKEINAAKNSAAGLIVYNNIPGIYQGTLINNITATDYKPSIPVVSMSMEEGLILKNMIESGDVSAELHVFFNPDVVATFSSRGPVSYFYMKPTLVAPGAYINSTSIQNSYDVTGGTSFAAPHVAGAAALLLQKHPDLTPDDIASILATTAKPIRDEYGAPYSFDAAGAGRLDIDAALRTNVIATPYYAILHLSQGKEISTTVELRTIEGTLGKLQVITEWDEFIPLHTRIEPVNNSTANLIIDAELPYGLVGKYEGRIYVETEQNRISIPLMVYADEATVNASNKDGRIWLSIDTQESWTFAKVRVINAENNRGHSITLTPSNNLLSVPARVVGEHWIEADVITTYGDVKGFSVIFVNDVTRDGLLMDYLNIYGIPIKEMLMVAAFLGVTAAIVFVWNRRNGSTPYVRENVY